MEKILQYAMYGGWGLWLLYSFVSLFRNDPENRRIRMHSVIGMLLCTLIIVSLFLLLSMDLEFGSNFFIEKYTYQTGSTKIDETGKKTGTAKQATVNESNSGNTGGIIIGRSEEYSHITLHNPSADSAHLRLIPAKNFFFLQNISSNKKVDLNHRYLNKRTLNEGDEIVIKGKEKIKVLSIGKQFPLGRAIRVRVSSGDNNTSRILTLRTLLNKPFTVSYGGSGQPTTAFNKLILPGGSAKTTASISYETDRYFLGMNIYYFIAFITVLLLSIGVYLYFKNRFNGGLLLLMLACFPFLAGFVPLKTQLWIMAAFIPIIVAGRRRKRNALKIQLLLVALFAGVFVLPTLLRMDGDFTLRHYDYSLKDSIRVISTGNSSDSVRTTGSGGNAVFLQDIRKKLAYNKKHMLILGHTAYELKVEKHETKTSSPKDPLPKLTITLAPVNPEIISISPQFKGIICDLNRVGRGPFSGEPDSDYIYLKYPHNFETLPASQTEGKEKLTIHGENGQQNNTIVLSRQVSNSYDYYLKGLLFYLLLPFLLFWWLDTFGIPVPGRRKPGESAETGWGFIKLNIFNRNNIIIFQVVYLLLGLGYVVFGALALYNSSYFKNFEKYKDQALPLFIGILFLALIFSKYNRWIVFAYRLAKQKKYYVPLIIGLLLISLDNYSTFFFYLGIIYLVYIYAVRLKPDLISQYKSTLSHRLNIKQLIETPISSFEDSQNQRFFFGLGRKLYEKGWNYFMVSDLLLLFALFFIVLQVFLGGELGVSVAGFFFLPIELGKILLTIYFADWVSRIDRGMELNVLWIYVLVSIPFFMLVVFLKDFSPLLVFSFVFMYHIIKINKPLIFKLFLGVLTLVALVITVTALNSYTLPLTFFSILLSLPLLLLLVRQWLRKRVLLSILLVMLMVGINYFSIFQAPSAPPVLGSRISSWLNPWQDYNLSYQYVNSLWLMKGTGTMGQPVKTLNVSSYVPLIEKDLSFSLYVSVLGILGALCIFLTLFLIPAYVNKYSRTCAQPVRGSPRRWYLYLMEFLTVIFLAQFLVPALYVVGLLPIMGQPLPFLSYSNNILLLFALPFSFLMIISGNWEVEEKKKEFATEDTEDTEGTEKKEGQLRDGG